MRIQILPYIWFCDFFITYYYSKQSIITPFYASRFSIYGCKIFTPYTHNFYSILIMVILNKTNRISKWSRSNISNDNYSTCKIKFTPLCALCLPHSCTMFTPLCALWNITPNCTHIKWKNRISSMEKILPAIFTILCDFYYLRWKQSKKLSRGLIGTSDKSSSACWTLLVEDGFADELHSHDVIGSPKAGCY